MKVKELQGIRLVIFDVDGTLVRPFTDELLPGVRDWVDAWRLLDEPPLLALATNQGGVGMRHHHQYQLGAASKYPTQTEAQARVRRVAARVRVRPEMAFMSFAYQFAPGQWTETPMWGAGEARWSRNWRKPNPGMLLAAMARARVSPLETVMVGDSDTDQEAAQKCGVNFKWANRFFTIGQMVLVA